MKSSLPKVPPGSHREAGSQRFAVSPQLTLQLDRERQLQADELGQRNAFRAAVQAFGGADALRAALGERETYLSKIAEALSGQRPIQERWRLPLLRDPAAAQLLLAHDAQLAGAEPPVFQRDVSAEDVARAAVEVLAESGQMRDTFRAQIAKRLGVRVEAVKL